MILRILASIRISRYYRYILLLGDLVALESSYLISFILRFGNLDRLGRQEPKTIFVLIPVIWIFLSYYFELNKLVRVQKTEKIVLKIIQIIIIHFFVVSSFVSIMKYNDISRMRIFYFYCSCALAIIIFRFVFITLIKNARRKGYNFRRVIIIGSPLNHKEIIQLLEKDLYLGYRIIGYVNKKIVQNTHLNYIGDIDNLLEAKFDEKIDEIFIFSKIKNIQQQEKLINYCDKKLIRLKIVPDLIHGLSYSNVNIDLYYNNPVISFRKEPLRKILNRIIKRLFDVFFSLTLILMVFSWLFPILFILIKIDSKGPVFYTQLRSGEDYKTFKCFKFRSMFANFKNFKQAEKNDPRVTKFGALLRRTNLDELPQFFNVLLGNMSVVGPRPHPIQLDDQYFSHITDYKVRHYIKPGITGWSQVNGLRGETRNPTEMKNRIKNDIWYVENWSFLLDLKIIGLTMLNMIRGQEKAY